MKISIELEAEEIEKLVEALGFPIENESDAETSIHVLIQDCM